VEGVVRWEALLLVGALIVFSGTAAVISAYAAYRVCLLVAGLERRIARLEMLAESGAPGAPARGTGLGRSSGRGA
jgi:hypothetical protein